MDNKQVIDMCKRSQNFSVFIVFILAASMTSGCGGADGADDGSSTQAAVECAGISCDTSNPCSTASCDAKTNTCVYTPNEANCDDGDPCTAGDRCSAGACVAGTQNACSDAGTSDSAAVPVELAVGAVVISELHYNPWGGGKVADAVGEWFEVYNPGDQPVNLSGVTIRDDGGDIYNVLGGKTTVAPKGYFVFAASADKAVNGGVDVDHVYGNSLTLNNKAKDSLTLERAGVVIDSVTYEPGIDWPFLNGVSMSLRSDRMTAKDNDDPTGWCGSTSKMASGDKGTPGTSNDACDYKDADNDGVADAQDNCPSVANPAQRDDDKNKKGDACEGPAPLCGNSKVDAAEECDDGNKLTGDGCSSYCLKETVIATGALVISELMANPKQVPDEQGEWFEVYNTTDKDIDLNGVVIGITVKGTFKQWVSASKPVIVKSKGYAVLGNNGDITSNGGWNRCPLG